MLMIPLANTSFLGIPMITAFFGQEMVSYGILYDQFGSFLALSIYGSIILAVYSGQDPAKPLILIRKIITFPPFIALVAALIFRTHIRQLPHLQSALKTLGESLVPVVMFAIGLQLKIRLPGKHSFLSPTACFASSSLLLWWLYSSVEFRGFILRLQLFQSLRPVCLRWLRQGLWR